MDEKCPTTPDVPVANTGLTVPLAEASLSSTKNSLPISANTVPLLLENKPVITPKNPENKKLLFVKSLRIAMNDGFNPIMVYAQCYHETANFRKLVGEFNYAGIKIPKKAIPPVAIKPIVILTHEVINGINTLLKDTFADFNSADDFMLFYIWQIKRLYKDSYENRNNPKVFFHFLTCGQNKWATDTTYSKKLEHTYINLISDGIYEQIKDIL